MVDSYFFWVDRNCPTSSNTGYMEPEKLFWNTITADKTLDMVKILRQKFVEIWLNASFQKKLQILYNDIGALYDSAGIPYSVIMT